MSGAMRVTQRSIGMHSLENLQGNLSRLSKLQEQLSSGKQISRPSDSPTGTVSALRFRGEIRQLQQFTRNADDGLGWLGTIDSTVTNSLDGIRRVRDLTLTGMNTGASGPEAREALAAEVDGLRSSLLAMANTTYLGRPVFGGTTPGSTAYDENGTFIGDTNNVVRTVGDNTTLRVDVNGPELFGTGDEQLFSVLASISDNMRNDPGALAQDLTRLDAAMKNMQNRLSDIGARTSRVEQSRQAADDRGLTIGADLANVESIDLPKTVMDLQMQEVAYQAALGATARVLQPTLMDFLR
jgi:flagellar hook-associated protein 3 FlgL